MLADVFGTPRDVLFAVRVVGWAAALPMLKRTRSVTRLVELMTPAKDEPRTAGQERNAIALSRWIYRVPFVHANCLERSLLAYRYLVRDRREHRLYLGIRSDEGTYPGHAWLTVDGIPVHEPDESLAAYVPLVVFDGYGRIVGGSGRPAGMPPRPEDGDESRSQPQEQPDRTPDARDGEPETTAARDGDVGAEVGGGGRDLAGDEPELRPEPGSGG